MEVILAKPDVVVICGGRSPEHDVSCRSAQSAIAALRNAGYQLRVVGIAPSNVWYLQDVDLFLRDAQVQEVAAPLDGFYPQTERFLTQLDLDYPRTQVVVLPMLHGHNGEDGTLQGMLALSGVPYVGADTAGAAIAFDKIITKELVQAAGIAVVESVTITATEWQTAAEQCRQRIAATLSLPLFIKPSRAGSSVGVSRITTQHELNDAIALALHGDGRVLVERAVDAVEVECAVIGDLRPESAPCLAAVDTVSGFYDYHAKYIDAHGVEVDIPARLTSEQVETVRDAAHRIFTQLCLHGLARVDFLLDKQRQRFYFNEVNTLPGFTDLSRFPLMWQRSGVSMEQLLAKLLQFAMQRQQRVDAWEQHLLCNRGEQQHAG